MKTGKQGQSLFEVVFAVGVIILVLTGVVALAVNSMGSRTRGYERKRASELGTKVIEGLIKEKNEDPLKFWKLAGAANQEDGDYPGYRYSLTFIDVSLSVIPVFAYFY